MKYFPLIWAALWRKPTGHHYDAAVGHREAITLFGIMVGFNAGHAASWSKPPRHGSDLCLSAFGGTLPLQAYREQILRLPGIAKIGYLGTIPGAYYQDKKNRVIIRMVDEGWTEVMTAWFPMTPARWHQLQASPTGVFVSRGIAARYHLKLGGAFPILTPTVTRADGSLFWPFTVIGILDDSPQEPDGYVLGSYTYLDESLPPALRSRVPFFDVLAESPDRSGDTAKAIDAMFANSPMPHAKRHRQGRSLKAWRGAASIFLGHPDGGRRRPFRDPVPHRLTASPGRCANFIPESSPVLKSLGFS